MDTKKQNIPSGLMVAARQLEHEREYWRNKLSGELIKTSFIYDFKPTKSKEDIWSNHNEILKFEIPGKQ